MVGVLVLVQRVVLDELGVVLELGVSDADVAFQWRPLVGHLLSVGVVRLASLTQVAFAVVISVVGYQLKLVLSCSLANGALQNSSCISLLFPLILNVVLRVLSRDGMLLDSGRPMVVDDRDGCALNLPA